MPLLEGMHKATDMLCTRGKRDFFHAEEGIAEQVFRVLHAQVLQVFHGGSTGFAPEELPQSRWGEVYIF
jgi:hypothetical protein